MARPENYDTRQGRSLLEFLQRHSGEHFDRKQLCARLREEQIVMGESTVWRYLDKLCREGRVRKSSPDGRTACYTYGCCEGEHYHLQCKRCKRLIHLECADFDSLRAHVLERHGFAMDPMNTTVSGLCRACWEKEGKPC